MGFNESRNRNRRIEKLLSIAEHRILQISRNFDLLINILLNNYQLIC